VFHTAIVTDPIHPEDVLVGLPSREDGACVLFLGVVRNHNEGRSVSGLEYEAYQEMAEKTLGAIAKEAAVRFSTERIAAIHRVGALEVGEISTAIGVATPHREEAFGASRYIIEELKKRLPVWKREHYLEGESRWVPGHLPAEGSGSEDGQPAGGGRGE